MAKMTAARVERWQKDLAKANQLIARTARDIGSAKLTTSGSVYSNLINLGGHLVPAMSNLDSIVLEDVEQSALHRVRLVVAQAADTRKLAKAAKDAERVAAGGS